MKEQIHYQYETRAIVLPHFVLRIIITFQMYLKVDPFLKMAALWKEKREVDGTDINSN